MNTTLISSSSDSGSVKQNNANLSGKAELEGELEVADAPAAELEKFDEPDKISSENE